MACDEGRWIVGGIGKGQSPDDPDIRIHAKHLREKIKADACQKEKCRQFGQPEGQEVMDKTQRRENLRVDSYLVGRHPAEHALRPKRKRVMFFLVLVGVLRHRLPLGDFSLLYNLMLENGLTVADG